MRIRVLNRAWLIVIAILLLTMTADPVPASQRYQRSIETYHLPDVLLTDHRGADVRLTEVMATNKPVLVDFIYATCTTICPILSAGYSNLQRKLGENSDQVQLISISIDPEYDKPPVMTEYLERYQAKKGWRFLTGSREDIDATMHAFDAYVSNKMSHYPLTLIKVPGKDEWVRLYGLVGTKELVSEVERLYGPLPVKGTKQ